MVFYVYSTATNAGSYCEYETNKDSNVAVLKKFANGKPMKVTINGGHGLANKHLFTPKGVMTKVEDYEMDFLLNNPAFKRHMERGFITYDKKNIDPAKKSANMAQKDGSAPLTPSDYVESEHSEPGYKIYKPKTSIHAGMEN